jgi:hypothetical protein
MASAAFGRVASVPQGRSFRGWLAYVGSMSKCRFWARVTLVPTMLI